MFECEISLILLCIYETVYAVLLLRVGRVVVHLCDHNYTSYDFDHPSIIMHSLTK